MTWITIGCYVVLPTILSTCIFKCFAFLKSSAFSLLSWWLFTRVFILGWIWNFNRLESNIFGSTLIWFSFFTASRMSPKYAIEDVITDEWYFRYVSKNDKAERNVKNSDLCEWISVMWPKYRFDLSVKILLSLVAISHVPLDWSLVFLHLLW